MHFLEYYYKRIIRYDISNKFINNYKIQNIPKLKKIVISISCLSAETQKLLEISFFLELIALNKPTLTYLKNHNVLLKMKKGTPVGCKVTLKGRLMYHFFAKILHDLFPKIKNFKKLKIKLKKNQKTLTYVVKENASIFPEFKKNFYAFKNNIDTLNITIVTNAKDPEKFFFFLQAFKIPVILKNR
jgi:large subunit ribosomal protein L5